MEKFHSIPKEKQQLIIRAAMDTFGPVGYKKAFISDIATAAGVSKALIFHYFGTKKNLYLYLIQYAFTTMKAVFSGSQEAPPTDFFDRIMLASVTKMSFLAKHPSLMQFAASVYYETDAEVADEVGEFLKQSEKFRTDLVLSDVDKEKFKESVEPALVLDLLVKYAEGFSGGRAFQAAHDFDMDRFRETLHMLKANLYREEYL